MQKVFILLDKANKNRNRWDTEPFLITEFLCVTVVLELTL